jgi:uncharacterized protein (DUF433 family)
LENPDMSDTYLLDRITVNPKVLIGKPVIRGTRLSVEYILNLLAHGNSVQDILEEYDGLTEQDIQACFLFASRSLESTSFMPPVMEPA